MRSTTSNLTLSKGQTHTTAHPTNDKHHLQTKPLLTSKKKALTSHFKLNNSKRRKQHSHNDGHTRAHHRRRTSDARSSRQRRRLDRALRDVAQQSVDVGRRRRLQHAAQVSRFRGFIRVRALGSGVDGFPGGGDVDGDAHELDGGVGAVGDAREERRGEVVVGPALNDGEDEARVGGEQVGLALGDLAGLGFAVVEGDGVLAVGLALASIAAATAAATTTRPGGAWGDRRGRAAWTARAAVAAGAAAAAGAVVAASIKRTTTTVVRVGPDLAWIRRGAQRWRGLARVELDVDDGFLHVGPVDFLAVVAAVASFHDGPLQDVALVVRLAREGEGVRFGVGVAREVQRDVGLAHAHGGRGLRAVFIERATVRFQPVALAGGLLPKEHVHGLRGAVEEHGLAELRDALLVLADDEVLHFGGGGVLATTRVKVLLDERDGGRLRGRGGGGGEEERRSGGGEEEVEVERGHLFRARWS